MCALLPALPVFVSSVGMKVESSKERGIFSGASPFYKVFYSELAIVSELAISSEVRELSSV
jgi:hypothetical protein